MPDYSTIETTLASIVASPRTLDLLRDLHKQALDEPPYVSTDGPTSMALDKFVALDPDKCAFIYLLLRSMQARFVVEAGTSFGVSTIYLALAVAQNSDSQPDSQPGKVIATENEAIKSARAREHWSAAGDNIEKYIELREGDLRETLKIDLPDQVDLLLLDIWTPLALPTLKLVQPRMRPGATVVVDNNLAAKMGYKDLVTYLEDPANGFKIKQPVEVKEDAISVGEFRGFSGRGTEATYVGSPVESSNIDVFAVHLQTGKVRRLTSHPEYCDPVAISPDDQWVAIEDTRGTDRQMWLSGMRNIPPITDLITTSVTPATRNSGQQRYFRPYLLDRYGDRGQYFGQKINGGQGVAGSGDLDDPEWNAMADPRWSPDGTQVVYWEAQTIIPACGGKNPLPCCPSREPGGRRTRVVLATLSTRKPLKLSAVKPISDEIPWGVPYSPSEANPARLAPPAGNYTLKGTREGYADVEVVGRNDGSISEISVTYYGYSDDGSTLLNGFEWKPRHYH
ncbi:hypothetical protein NCS55_01088300 [Fusarium keratoplasticum]|nr:hypothetical protein NCS55_01088300 [Fusarium keratoplasticum]